MRHILFTPTDIYLHELAIGTKECSIRKYERDTFVTGRSAAACENATSVRELGNALEATSAGKVRR